MERSRLKHVMIVLLIVLNLFLLTLVLVQYRQSSQYEEITRENVLSYLKKNGISVGEGIVPWKSTQTVLNVPWSQDRDRTAAETLLVDFQEGSETSQLYFQGAGGTFTVSRNGGFSLTLKNGETTQDKEKAAAALMQKLNFEGAVAGTRQTGDSTTVALRQSWKGKPIFSCAAQVRFQGDCLAEAQGIRLPGVPEGDSGIQVRSAETLLVDFLRGVSNLGEACTQLRAITEGYLLNTDGLVGKLLPAWLVETDGGLFQLNCVTGELTVFSEP